MLSKEVLIVAHMALTLKIQTRVMYATHYLVMVDTCHIFRYVICEMRIDSRCVSTQCLFYNIQVITDVTSAQPFPAVIT